MDEITKQNMYCLVKKLNEEGSSRYKDLNKRMASFPIDLLKINNQHQ
jgi:hypothetical protein